MDELCYGAHCFFAMTVSTMSVISSLIAQDLEIILDLCGPTGTKKIMSSNPTDGSQIANFISSLDRQRKALLLPEQLRLPFDQATATLATRFVTTAVSIICHLKPERLRELEAP